MVILDQKKKSDVQSQFSSTIPRVAEGEREWLILVQYMSYLIQNEL